MAQQNQSPNQPPLRPAGQLVQIEPLKKAEAASEHEPQLPVLSDWQIYRTKTFIAVRKITGFFYTKHSYGATRRWLLAKTLPDEVLYRWKPYQRGGCTRCGACCKIIFRCSFYYEDEKTTACMIYTSPRHAPPPCVVFPIDPLDLREVQREVAPTPCPFWFEGEPEHPTTWGALKAYWRGQWERKIGKLKEEFDF